jgi:hypothetical protein
MGASLIRAALQVLADLLSSHRVHHFSAPFNTVIHDHNIEPLFEVLYHNLTQKSSALSAYKNEPKARP